MAAALKASRASRAVTHRVSRARTCTVAAASRPLWLPGSTPPAYLTGSLPGDFGFDPLGLGKDAKTLSWYVQAEVFHCRVAMAGVAGIVIPGLLTQAGVLNVPDWFEAGKIAQDSSPISFEALVGIELLAVGFVEGKRWESINEGTGTAGYPGGAFDPLGLSKDASKLAEYKLKEVKNGRLAMLAFLGFTAQHFATGKSPFENLAAHLADPAHANFAENGVSLPFL